MSGIRPLEPTDHHPSNFFRFLINCFRRPAGSQRPPEVSPKPISRNSTIPSHDPAPFNHGRHASSGKPRQAVRLPDRTSAAAYQGPNQLKPGHAYFALIVTYQCDQPDPAKVLHIKDGRVEYTESTAFQELEAIALRALEEKIKQPSEAFYRKVGRFRLIRDLTGKAVSRGILETKREWDEYFKSSWKISEFRGRYPDERFYLEIEWEYSSLQIVQDPNNPGETYARTVSNALEAKMKSNWNDKKYVPRKDLEKILTKDTISKLIRHDESLYSARFLTLSGGTKLDVDQFIEDIWIVGSRLLALCIYHELPLLCLYEMRQKKLEDSDLPLSKDHCPDPSYRRLFDMAVTSSGGFAAHTFAPNADGQVKHETLKDDALVPILFNEKNKASLLGEGSFGRVYKARIDRDHHSFSDIQDEFFAFKVFYDLSAHTPQSVENESDTLSRLAAAPHPNITTHLASWKQKNICYMLFRCADYNLRDYMMQPSPELSKSHVLAIISQMWGLADGVRHIHNLGPAHLEPKRVEKKRKSDRHANNESCFHHDLKPANILVTTDHDTGNLLFSISDFGSAKIGEILSGSLNPSPFTQNRAPGDAVYGAPDAFIDGHNSRPYDLWSMGCIFLELLTWFVDLKDYNVQVFADKRLETPTYGNQSQAFWYLDQAGQVRLKPAVVRQLKALQIRCAGRGVLPGLVKIIMDLLQTDPRKRAKAHDVTNDLDAIMVQARLDLKDENFYINNIPTAIHMAAPPLSSVADSEEFQRRLSINERPIIAPFADSLPIASGSGRRQSISHTSSASKSANEYTLHKSHLQINTNMQATASSNYDSNEAQTFVGINTPRISLSDYDNGDPMKYDLLHLGQVNGT